MDSVVAQISEGDDLATGEGRDGRGSVWGPRGSGGERGVDDGRRALPDGGRTGDPGHPPLDVSQRSTEHRKWMGRPNKKKGVKHENVTLSNAVEPYNAPLAQHSRCGVPGRGWGQFGFGGAAGIVEWES